MSEHHIPVRHEKAHTKEHHAHSKEHLAKVEAGRAEKAAEHSHAQRHHETAKARHEAHEAAISAAEYAPIHTEQAPAEEFRTKETKAHSFNTTMHHVRSNMKAPERAFSSFIHKPAVEKTSEILGNTVARPSGIMGATIAGFIGLFLIYSVAKYAGFRLSGSEMPLLLLIGFISGLCIEWFYKASRSVFAKRNTRS